MKLYFLLSQTGTLLSRIIRLFTKYPYNHVSIGFDSKLEELYSFARKKPRNPFLGGFVTENIHDGLFKIKKNTKCIVLVLNVSKEQAAKIDYLLQKFIQEKDNYKYNFLGLLRNAFNMGQEKEKKKFFCSEFAAKVLTESGVWNFQKAYVNVKPQDFLRIKGIKKVYEGKLFEY